MPAGNRSARYAYQVQHDEDEDDYDRNHHGEPNGSKIDHCDDDDLTKNKDSAADQDGRWMMGFMFRKPMNCMASDMFIHAITRAEYVHVDILFFYEKKKRVRITTNSQEGREKGELRAQEESEAEEERRRRMRSASSSSQSPAKRSELFSIFMGEKFAAYTTRSWSARDNDTHSLLVTEIQEHQFDKARKYVADLCMSDVSYNYKDLCSCLIPNAAAMAMLKDVDPYPIPKNVYCSQAVVLVLRYALSDVYDGEKPFVQYRADSSGDEGAVSHPLLEAVERINSRSCSPMMLYNIMKNICVYRDVPTFVSTRE